MRDLEEGIESNKFGNIINEFLTDRNVEDLFNTKDALEFEYTWWPQPGNKSMIRQMLMDVSRTPDYSRSVIDLFVWVPIFVD